MHITIHQTGKRFGHKWVFKNLQAVIEPGRLCAITGRNGSGKSTLALMLAGLLSPSRGQISWQLGHSMVHRDRLFKHLSIATPYLSLIDDFSLKEMIRFHQVFKQPIQNMSLNETIAISGLDKHADKLLKYFSSGMKQRVKLLLAMTSNVDLILLDEPCTNLDAEGVSWYHNMLTSLGTNRSIVVASNHKAEEYPGAQNFISL